MLHKLITLSVMFIYANSATMNDSAELISTYAKVARWGSVSTTDLPNEGRSNGQSLWTHRSDASIRRGQNLKSKQPVTYYYSMGAPSSKVDKIKEETIPSKGEILERFNPRPYFDFSFDNPPRSNNQRDPPKSGNSADKPKPAIIYGTPVNSNFNPKPPIGAYDSPFSSYNPPNNNPNDSKDNAPVSYNYPPNDNQSPPYTVSVDQSSKDAYGSPNEDQPIPPSSSLYGNPSNPSISNDFYTSPALSNSKPKPLKQNNDFHPPLAPFLPSDDSDLPKHPDDSYSQENGDDSSNAYYGSPKDHPYDNDNNNNDYHGPPITPTVSPPESPKQPYFDHPPTSHDYHPDHHSAQPPSMAESDLNPPPSGVPYGRIPQYLDHEPNTQDFYHFGHDVYHEVHHTTTTTTEAPRAGHYSYYYLGRKLWYIPLYFSVYFIVYVTVLILKSIARHKIQFSHNFDKGRSSREFNLDSVNQTVIDAIENIDKKYM